MDGCTLTSSWFMTAVISRPLTSKGDILFKFLPLRVYRESSQTLISTFFFLSIINRYAFHLSLRSCDSTLPATLK